MLRRLLPVFRLQPWARFADMDAAFRLLREPERPDTIVRAARLTDEPGTGRIEAGLAGHLSRKRRARDDFGVFCVQKYVRRRPRSRGAGDLLRAPGSKGRSMRAQDVSTARRPASGPLGAGVVLAGLILPTSAWAQIPIRMPDRIEPLEMKGTPRERAETMDARVAADSTTFDLRWRAAYEFTRAAGIEPEPEVRKALGYRAIEHARSAIQLRPERVEGHYWLGMAAGLVGEVEGGRTKIRLTNEAWQEAGVILKIDSLHAGGNYLRGRIHAAVQRVNPVLRFLARVLLGADAVGEATWEGALHHLERAVKLEPQTPMYHVELAMVYSDLGRTDDMRASLEAAVEARGSDNPVIDAAYRARARRLLEVEGGGEAP